MDTGGPRYVYHNPSVMLPEGIPLSAHTAERRDMPDSGPAANTTMRLGGLAAYKVLAGVRITFGWYSSTKTEKCKAVIYQMFLLNIQAALIPI